MQDGSVCSYTEKSLEMIGVVRSVILITLALLLLQMLSGEVVTVFRSMGASVPCLSWFCWEQSWSCGGASAGGRAALSLPCHIPALSYTMLLFRGALLSFHAWLDGIPSIVAV